MKLDETNDLSLCKINIKNKKNQESNQNTQ